MIVGAIVTGSPVGIDPTVEMAVAYTTREKAVATESNMIPCWSWVAIHQPCLYRSTWSSKAFIRHIESTKVPSGNIYGTVVDLNGNAYVTGFVMLMGRR